MLLGVVLVSCYDDDINDIKSRLEEVENSQNATNSQIATITQQINSIYNSIQLLTKTDAELKSYIENLEKEVEQFDDINVTLDELKAKDLALESLISALNRYVDSELKSATDWVSATFATLGQYNTLAKELASLKTYIGNMESSLVDAIDALESSMTTWVNEKLTGYYTIAEIDAKIKVLENDYSKGQEQIEKDIVALQNNLETTKQELVAGYQDAIADAIQTNNGVINAKIDAEISTVNDKIADLENRLADIESRLSAVEDALAQIKALDITFDTTDEVACMAGTSVLIGYTITGGDDETSIEAWGDCGWRATVVSENPTTGRIKVTSPSDATNGKVVVLVTSGAGGVKMKTLHFVEGVLNNIHETYEVDWEACTLQINLQTNLNYYVRIPSNAQSWITLEKTRASLRSETLTFNIAENSEEISRSAVIEIIGECGDVMQSFEIEQKLQPSDGYIYFADKYAKLVCVENFDTNGDGEISFKEASKVLNVGTKFFGDYAATITSFDELQYFTNIISIDNSAFANCTNLISVVLPNGITQIMNNTFSGCSKLKSITIPKRVTGIGQYAFENCESLTDFIMSENLTTIGSYAFYNCSSLLNIIFPNSLQSINSRAFYGCKSLEGIIIPDNASSIGSYAFYGCNNLKSVVIGDGETLIGDYAFYSCANLLTVTIGDGVKTINSCAFNNCPKLSKVTIGKRITSIGSYAFYGCSSLANVCCKAINPPSLGNDNVFNKSVVGRKFYVPTESVWLYQSTKWKAYTDDIVGYDFE